MSNRKYTKRRRAQQEADTRQRIVAAAAELHGEMGVRDSTVTAIAARAGVQRLTVYRHFPDEHELVRACTAHWLTAHPPPEPGQWNREGDAAQRSRAALVALYRYYRGTSEMWRLAYRDRDDVPSLRGPMLEFEQYLDGLGDDLVGAWAPGRREAGALRAVVGHALSYSSWRSLAGRGLSDEDMADLVVAWLRAVAGG